MVPGDAKFPVKLLTINFVAEWFSSDLKSLVSSSIITFQFLMIFIAVQTTTPIINLVGNSGLFVFFCSVCAVKTIFVVIFVPETHGKTFALRKTGTQV